ncbi:hypothetical protein FRC18_006477, partial [Serendipita sp. 400]
MAAPPLIVPTLSPSGAIHFAAVTQDATVQDIIDALSTLDDVKEDILGGLEDCGWDVQKIRRSPPSGWDEAELRQFGNGLLDRNDKISPLLNSSKPPSLQRHFSAFPLSSHLHTPSIRLVSLHQLLRVTLTCLRVPDLEDDVDIEWFLARNVTAEEVVNGMIEEFGLTKVMGGVGGGNIDYVLEEAWVPKTGDPVTTRISSDANVSHIVETPLRPSPFPANMSARRIIRFCVPDEWYRRSKSRSLSLTPIDMGESSTESSSINEEDDESGGTEKQRPKLGMSAIPISPQTTGSGLMKRFSIWSVPPSSTALASVSSQPDIKQPEPESSPVVPQTTGGLWSSWWSGGSREPEKLKESDHTGSKSTGWYVEGIRNGKSNDTRLAKHLITLRVHLSTAKVAWIETFLDQEKGLEALSTLLGSLVGKGRKGRKLGDTEELVLLEVVKCLRVLLNTAPGYAQVLRSPALVTYITFALHGAGSKLRALTCDLLAAICVLSLSEGHRLVVGALSDYRVAFDEKFRFEELMDPLKLESDTNNQPTEDEGVWEARGATMGLIIALTSCSDALEERILLREEFSRRGLNEIMVGLRYIGPPESLVRQLDAYAEERFEDEEDLREQTRGLHEPQARNKTEDQYDPTLEQLVRIRNTYPGPFLHLELLLNVCEALLQRFITPDFKNNLFFILRTFAEHLSLLDDLDNWSRFLDQFSTSLEPLI